MLKHVLAYCCILLSICIGSASAQVTPGDGSSLYKTSMSINSAGKPVLSITNTGTSSITGLAVTVDLSNGAGLAEERIYYDSAMDSFHNAPIVPGHTERIPVGFVVGSDVTKLSPKVHAVLYYDGTTVGELAWVNTVLGRRERLAERLAAIATLMDTHASSLVGADPVSDLRDAKRQAHLDLPEDDTPKAPSSCPLRKGLR